MHTQPHQPGSGLLKLKSHRPRAIRPLDRYGGARAIRDSPSDVGACHRVVRRHTCCSLVTRRSIRATRDTSARAAPGVHVCQPTPKAASKVSHEARPALRSAWGRTHARTASPQLRIATIRHGLNRKFSFSFPLVLVILATSPFSSQDEPPEKKVPLGIRLKSTRPSQIRSSLHKSFVKTIKIRISTPPVEVKFFWNNFTCGSFLSQKN